jgi:hypothetical protein
MRFSPGRHRKDLTASECKGGRTMGRLINTTGLKCIASRSQFGLLGWDATAIEGDAVAGVRQLRAGTAAICDVPLR